MQSIRPNEAVTFKVRYRDEHLLVVEKPPGRVTQPGIGHEHDSLLNGLFVEFGPRLQNLGRARDFGLLHRLDRQASGLLIVGLRPRTYDRLREMFEAREVRKYYWAVVHSTPREPSGIVRRALLEFERGGRKLSRPSREGKPAVTAYRVLEAGEEFSMLECRTLTGRLHQVRVHMEAIGCPIVGDEDYAPPSVARAARRLALHAHRVVFAHPETGVRVDVRAPWPRDLRALLARAGLSRPDLASGDGGHEVSGDGIGDEEPGIGEGPPAG